MNNNSWVWVLIPLAAITAGVVRTWVRARHGYPLDKWSSAAKPDPSRRRSPTSRTP